MNREGKSCRILNLEGAYLVSRVENAEGKMINKFEYSTADKKVNKIYRGTMPYSLETYRAFNLVPKDEVWNTGRDQFTNLFVNIKFTKDFKDDKTTYTLNKKRIRTLLYTNNVLIDGVKYKFFKRGASKARNANVIFVKSDYYSDLYMPCLLGLHFEVDKEYDITSREAYTSLIMSQIIGVINNISRENILIIKDIMSPEFKAIQTLTVKDEVNGVHQIEDEYGVVNNCTDGEGIMDESLWITKGNEILNKATCALLRNDFTKVNVCRTRLQEYYTENGITTAYDAWRRPKDASKILLVLTPSACKYIKFNNQFEDEKACYDDWLAKISTTFGIVKIDHIGNYGYSNRLSYQMINSMNLSKIEVRELVRGELDYIKLFKDNTSVTSEELRKMGRVAKKLNRDERNKMSYILDTFDSSQEGSTGEMIGDLLKTNSKFKFTPKFKNWKSKQLQDYVDNLRLGKIRIQNSLYAIMISCPYEFMLATTNIDNKVDKCIMSGWETYCPRFEEDEKLLLIRNPQINAGNIGFSTNKYHDEYKWFGYYEDGIAKHDFVIFVNSYDKCDIMNRLQGCDWDIDTVYVTNNDLLRTKASESQEWITPVNGIRGTTGLKKNNMKSLADLDNYLGGSTQTIGKIVNKSAIFNGLMYDAINKGKSQKYIDACYDASSICSSFSQIAIDMAKKNFKGLSLNSELSKLNKTTFKNIQGMDETIIKSEIDEANTRNISIADYNKELAKCDSDDEKYDDYEMKYKIVGLKYVYDNMSNKFVHMYEVVEQKMVVPYFFKYIAKKNDYRIPTHMDCSMDYLEEILDEVDLKAMNTDKVNIQDLFQMQKELTGTNFNATKVDKTRMILSDCQTQLNNKCYDKNDSKHEAKGKRNLRRWLKNTATDELKALGLNPKTVYRIVMRAFGADDKYKGIVIPKMNKKGEAIVYVDDKMVEHPVVYKELSEMTMTVLNLMYNAYGEDFLNCFKDDVTQDKEVITQYWS